MASSLAWIIVFSLSTRSTKSDYYLGDPPFTSRNVEQRNIMFGELWGGAETELDDSIDSNAELLVKMQLHRTEKSTQWTNCWTQSIHCWT